MRTLSRNATFNSHGQDSSYFLGWQEYEKNPYHEVHNPNGIIQMGLAENQLCFDLLESWLAKNPEAAAFKKNGESIFAELALFQDYHGLPAFKKAMVDFMAEIRGNKVTFDPNHLVLTAGATSANETLIFCLADPGEAVLIPTPYYPASRNLWLPIKHGARVSQKDKLGLTFFFAILLPGWIPVVNAVDENAFLRGTISPCTWFWIIIITIASAYCAYKILRRSPPEPYLLSEKVRIWINGEMNVEVYDDEGILVGSWRCALSTANGEWVTHLLNCVLHIFVQQEDGVEEITFNQMDDPKFIGMPKDVYLHNPNTGLLRYIGRSVPQNGAPSERDILRVRTMLM